MSRSNAPTRWEKHGATVLLSLIGLTVVFWALGVSGLVRLRSEPGWWPRVDATDPLVAAKAERFERVFSNEVSRVREPTDEDGSDWAVAIDPEHANAWLANRLPAWVDEEDWPEEIGEVRVGFDGSNVRLGARVLHSTGSSIVWVTVSPEVREDGSVWVRAHDARIGRVSVPGSWVLSGLERDLANDSGVASAIGGDARRILGDGSGLRSMLTGQAPVSVEPVVHLPDGRDVRILQLRARDGRVEVALRTE